ncbi:protein kinase domain-containing protein [Ditylenchus destructor]|uniref:mitogen-activated protein kinase kinase n=1 Tax=Ditylenchus destructor TaxID=166010 RepID=A0AAD4N5Z3_9BILA|nr:protein kinase domain-containing protein [Ditylenchus destructor]
MHRRNRAAEDGGSSSPYHFLVFPLQQRLIEFEARLSAPFVFLRRWRSKRSASARRSRSTEGRRENRSKIDPNAQPGISTCPVPRKSFEMLLSRRPRPRPTLDPVSTSSDSYSPQEVADRFEHIQKLSGRLNINGKIFEHIVPEDLEMVCELGEGVSGNVTKCRLKNRALAVKRMKRTDNHEESKRIFMDLEVIRKCNDCDYIVKCYGYIITFEHLFICMEVMATCLDKLLQRRKCGLPEQIIGKITLSVVYALDYLKEKHKIMHRDIKPSNILLDWHGNIKLCDFGISGKLIDSKAITMSAGCAAYLAPERIQADSGYGYDVRADVWSLGISIVQLATGKFPYESSTPFELMVKIREEQPPLLNPDDGFSREFCDFVRDCLHKDMTGRPKFKDLLEKPFLVRSAAEQTDVGQWYQEECTKMEVDNA